MKGRPKKPTEMLKLSGTFRKDRRHADEPTPDIAIPDMPTFLKGEARKEWLRIAPLLASRQCLTEWDRSMLAAYCFEWGQYVKLCQEINKSGYTETTSNGNIIQNPLVGAKNKSLKNCKEIALEFGLTPSSRTRLSISQVEADNPFKRLMERNLDITRK
jgi:P27 family predicted phage terminase small subunit